MKYPRKRIQFPDSRAVYPGISEMKDYIIRKSNPHRLTFLALWNIRAKWTKWPILLFYFEIVSPPREETVSQRISKRMSIDRFLWTIPRYLYLHEIVESATLWMQFAIGMWDLPPALYKFLSKLSDKSYCFFMLFVFILYCCRSTLSGSLF